MTDKELKKLSRLELLELLLAESRENERLREELEKIKLENTINKSAQQLNETSESLDRTTEKLGEALQQVSLMMSGFTGVAAEDKKDSSSDDVIVNDEMNVIQETQIVSEPDIPEVPVEDKSSSSDDEATKNHEQCDISKRLDAALQFVSSKIKELDRLAGVMDVSEERLSLFDVDEN